MARWSSFLALVATMLVAVPGLADDRRCFVDRQVGFTEDDVAAIEQIACGEVTTRLPGRHVVRVVRLGRNIFLTLADPANERDGEQLVIVAIEEIPTAIGRLVDARLHKRPVRETENVNNVAGGDTRAPLRKSGHVRGELGGVGAVVVGSSAAGTTGGGFELGLLVGTPMVSFRGGLRFTSGDILGFTLQAGTRIYLLESDTAPFVGGGLGLAHQEVDHARGGGLALHVEAGVEALRTHKAGGYLALRGDAPTFVTEETIVVRNTQTLERRWLPTVSLGLGMRF